MDKVKATKIKKPFYKKWWVWVIAILIIGAIGANGDDDNVKETSEKIEVLADKTQEVKKEKELFKF